VPDVERQPEEPAEAGNHPQKKAERDAGRPAGGVARKRVGEAAHPHPPDALAERVFRDRARQAVVGRPVVEPAADHAREPEEHPRLGRIENGQAVQRRERLEHVLGVVVIEVGVPRDQAPQVIEGVGPGRRDGDVTDGRGQLRAHDRRRVVHDIVELARAAPLAQDRRERRRGHRGLLRREDQPERLQQQKLTA
jgi:hypothetical protein